MKLRLSNQKNHALTLVEVLVVIVLLLVVAALLLPVLAKAKRRGSHINCVNGVKQICISSLVWAYDHNGKFPMEVSMAEGGTKELAVTGDAVATFQVMSNELATPKVLICPEDTDHFFATNFSTAFSAKNISYFIGLDASTNFPQAFLCGDDNFEISGIPVKSGSLELLTNAPIAWSAARHKFVGNIGLADGSVQMVTTRGLQQAIQNIGLATNRLAIP